MRRAGYRLGRGAPGAIVVLDTFTRDDSATDLGTSDSGHAWTAVSGTWGIASNTGYKAVDSVANDVATVESGLADCVVQVTLSTIEAGAASARLALRVLNASNMIFVVANNSGNTYQVIRRQTASNTTLATVSRTPVAGDVVRATMKGSRIIVSVNGTNVADVTDSFGASRTTHGISAGTTVPRFDRFEVRKLR